MAEDRAAIRRLIFEALERLGWTLSQLSRASSVPHPTLSKVRAMKVQASSETCIKLAPWLGVSEDALLALAGHKHSTGRALSRDALLNQVAAVDAIEVPIYDVAVSASPGRSLLNDEPADYGYLPNRSRYRRGRIRGVRVRGDCLAPRIKDGDLVFIDTEDRDWSAGDVVLAVVDDALHLKRLRPDGAGWTLAPDNGEAAIPVGETVVILGKYHGLWRQGL